jgi:magnesium-transporting ATPase (P-type)
MYNDEIKRLDFEDLIWIVFIILSIGSIVGDNYQKIYIKTKNNSYKNKANNLFEIILFITLLIYIYFIIRNYYFWKKESNKQLYFIKLLGSAFLLAGVLCLIYFQTHENDFVGTPAI